MLPRRWGLQRWRIFAGAIAKVDYRSIPAAAFTHPEISYVGMTEPAAKELGKTEGFEVATVKSYFKGQF